MEWRGSSAISALAGKFAAAVHSLCVRRLGERQSGCLRARVTIKKPIGSLASPKKGLQDFIKNYEPMLSDCIQKLETAMEQIEVWQKNSVKTSAKQKLFSNLAKDPIGFEADSATNDLAEIISLVWDWRYVARLQLRNTAGQLTVVRMREGGRNLRSPCRLSIRIDYWQSANLELSHYSKERKLWDYLTKF